MEQPVTTADDRREPDDGRVAVPEIAELLHIQRPAAIIAAAVVVLVGLVMSLVAPSVLPANAVTGLGVGILALVAAVVAAVVLDGRDPVVRGPRHLRRDGHTVLARMAGPDPVDHGGPVLRALERRLADRDHLSVLLTGTGTDPSALAEALGRGAAGDGHTALVIDLRASGAPGVCDVGAGTVRLGEAATIADDRPYAWIGAGVDREAAIAAAAGVVQRPPRDLQLLVVVAPDAATQTPELLAACDRTLLLVAADTHQRGMVSTRFQALTRAGATPEAVVVGGLHVAVGDQPVTVIDEEPEPWSAHTEAVTVTSSPAAEGPPVEDEGRPQPFAPAEPPVAQPTEAPPAIAPDAAPTPPVPPGDEVPPHADESREGRPDDVDDAGGVDGDTEEPGASDVPRAAASPPSAAQPSTAARTSAAAPQPPAAPTAPGATTTPDTDFVDIDGQDDAETVADADDAHDDDTDEVGREQAAAEPRETPPTPPPTPRGGGLDDTQPIRPVTFGGPASGAGDADGVGGFATPDPLSTTAALDRLLRERRGEA